MNFVIHRLNPLTDTNERKLQGYKLYPRSRFLPSAPPQSEKIVDSNTSDVGTNRANRSILLAKRNTEQTSIRHVRQKQQE